MSPLTRRNLADSGRNYRLYCRTPLDPNERSGFAIDHLRKKPPHKTAALEAARLLWAITRAYQPKQDNGTQGAIARTTTRVAVTSSSSQLIESLDR